MMMGTSVGKEKKEEEEEENMWRKCDKVMMERESDEDESLKIASAETSSSELTQGILLDEANNSSNFPLHFSSSLLDDHDQFFANYSHLPYYPPLQLQDFPQISINEAQIMSTEYSKQQDFQCRDSMNGTLDEIFSFSSSATFPLWQLIHIIFIFHIQTYFLNVLIYHINSFSFFLASQLV